MRQAVLLHVDLCGVAEIAATHGPVISRAVVETMAARLRAVVGEDDDVTARGPGRFVVECSPAVVPGARHRLADRLRRSVEEPMMIDDAEVRLSAAVVVEDGETSPADRVRHRQAGPLACPNPRA